MPEAPSRIDDPNTRIRALEARIAALESVLQVQGGHVTLHSSNRLTIATGDLDMTLNGNFNLRCEAATTQARNRYAVDALGLSLVSQQFASLQAGSNLRLSGTSTAVTGLSTTLSGTQVSITSGAGLEVKSSANLAFESTGRFTAKSGRDMTLRSGDGLAVTAGDALALSAGDDLTLKTGAASEQLKKDGAIDLKGRDIKIVASGRVDVKGQSDVAIRGSKVAAN